VDHLEDCRRVSEWMQRWSVALRLPDEETISNARMASKSRVWIHACMYSWAAISYACIDRCMTFASEETALRFARLYAVCIYACMDVECMSTGS
jgi:hypothetical protein